MIVVENGVPVAEFPESPPAGGFVPGGRFRVLFVGSMDYYANVDAAGYFSREAWPAIRERVPGAVLTIVGRDPASEVRDLAALPGIEVTGTVPDGRRYYGEAFVALVPVRVAGGTRIKILEAMAAGVPVVATSRGAEGLEAVPGVHYLLAETGPEMADAVVELSRDALKAGSLAREGRELVRQRYDWAALGDVLAERLMELAEGRKNQT